MKKEEMPKWPIIPTVITDPENVSIGKPNEKMPKDRIATPQDKEDTSVIEAAAKLITK